MSSAAIEDDLTPEEVQELSASRSLGWARTNAVEPFTPAEARFHAREFIASNQRNNLVRLLAEAYLRLEAESNG